MRRIFLSVIKLYKRHFTRFGLCRLNPTCSEYMYQSIEKHGVLRGLLLGLKRILKCNILFTPSPGKYDPVI